MQRKVPKQEQDSLSSDTDAESIEAADAARVQPIKKARKDRTAKDVEHLRWLTQLMHDLGFAGDGEAGEEKTDLEFQQAPGAPECSRSSASAAESSSESAVLQAQAESLVQEAFGPTADDVGEGSLEEEEEITQALLCESGLDIMADREQKLIQHACEEFSRLNQSKAAASPVLEENIARAIDEHVQAGLEPEEAAEEATLKQELLLGNENLASLSVEGDADAADGEAGAGEACPRLPSLLDNGVDGVVYKNRIDQATSTWLEEAVLSFKALASRSQALLEKEVGQNGELTLGYGDILGTGAPADHCCGSKPLRFLDPLGWQD